MNKWYAFFLTMLLASGAPSAGASAQRQNSPSHDFDYQFGTWRVHVSRLLDPRGASPHWAQYDGTHAVTPLMGGRANVGVLELTGRSGRLEGLQLRLFDPATRQWRLSFANGSDGVVQPPAAGRFENGRGTFYSSQQLGGSGVRIRTSATPLGASSYRDVIAYSRIGSTQWHPIWIATYTKVAGIAQAAAPAAGGSRAVPTAFDFQIGRWCVRLDRLPARLRGSRAWRTYEGTLVVRRLWNGRANVGELDVRDGAARMESILLRTYDPRSTRWSDYSVDVADGSIALPPVTGHFSNGRGELTERDHFEGRPIVVRYVFDEITARSSRFVQSFSADDGRTWETNAVAHFTKAR